MTLRTPPPRPLAATVEGSTEVELFSVAGLDGHLREANAAFAALLGLPLAQVNGKSLLELVHPDDIPAVVAGLSALEGGAVEVMVENRFLQEDSEPVHLQWVARPLPGTDLWWAAGRDTTAFHQLLSARQDLSARLELALGQATAAMWELDLAADLLTWEPQAADVLGVSSIQLPGSAAALVAFVHPQDADLVRAALSGLADTGAAEAGARIGEDPAMRHVSLRGRVIERDRRGRPQRAVGLVLDVTAEKAMEEQMLRMVMSDALTGIPNRRAFDHALRSEWRRANRAAEPLSVVMVDIDDFKQFNDTYGHLIGDEALIAVARALVGVLDRAGDVAARFGGEEFAAVLPGTPDAGAVAVAEQMLVSVRGVKLRQAPDWEPSVSIGIATWHPGGAATKAAELLAAADQALYAAKSTGKNRVVAAGT